MSLKERRAEISSLCANESNYITSDNATVKQFE